MRLTRKRRDGAVNRRRYAIKDGVDLASPMGATSSIGVEPIPSKVVKRCRHITVDEMRTDDVEEFAE